MYSNSVMFPYQINFCIDFCSACCIGKSHRLPSTFSNTLYTYNFPLELVHNDLWGPSHIPSYHGFYYYITFVDAFSWYIWIYKSDAFSVSTIWSHDRNSVWHQTWKCPNWLGSLGLRCPWNSSYGYLSSYSPLKWCNRILT